MKKLFSIMLITLAFSAAASAQQIEKLFDKYMEDERFNYIYKKGSAGSILNRTDMENLKTDAFNIHFKSDRNKENEKMLILNSSNESFQKSFLAEVDKALETDKFENTSYVRNGKSNRVSEYVRKSSGTLEEVQVIENGSGNIVLKWEIYTVNNK
ncbi:hypothetical protein [uncultured Proteiniphilum sp.]|uniref:hypothetical protein n=1 Tax=uncultured Proteiniphilum sp. TaxID=497637 RepID=UPI0026323951|nr:hypothetical protein [uncultured Proteiniphilum sp.]